MVAYHLGYLSGGFLGVDLFFVLSGYLVTSLALDEQRRTETLDCVAFWGRRVRRLAPALFVMVPVAVLAATRVHWPRTAYDALGWDAVSTLTWWANWHQALGASGGYWSSTPQLFRHAWSLSVEEQFYVAWPLVLVGAFTVARRVGRSPRLVVGAVSGAVVVASAAWSVWLAHRLTIVDLSRVYVGTDTRIATPLLGCLLACLPVAEAPRRSRQVLAVGAGVVAAAALAVLMVRIDVSDPALYRTGLLPGVAVLGAVLIVAARVLPRTDPVTRWLGKRSYAIYLWSWPLQVLIHQWKPLASRGKVALVVVPASLLIAEASWWIVELPAQRRTGWARPRAGRRAAAVTFPAVAALAVALLFVRDLPPSILERADTATAVDLAERPPPTAPPGSPGYGGDRVAVFGDSVAFTFAYLSPPAGSVPGIASVDGRGLIGCGLLASDGYQQPGPGGHGWVDPDPLCRTQDQVEEVGLRRHPSVVLLVPGAWEFLPLRSPDGTVVDAQSPEMHDLLVADLVREAGRADRVGARTAIVTWSCPGDRADPGGRRDPAYVRWMHRVVLDAAADGRARGYDVSVIEPTPEVCVGGDPAGAPTPAKDEAFNHEVHIRTLEGGVWLWDRWLGPALAASRPR